MRPCRTTALSSRGLPRDLDFFLSLLPFSTCHPAVRYTPKRASAVMELADIVAREVCERARSGCTVEPKFWDVVSPRFYARGDFSMGKFGLKIFPDRNIRDLVEAHRERFGPIKN